MAVRCREPKGTSQVVKKFSKAGGNGALARTRLVLDALLLIALITLAVTGFRQPQPQQADVIRPDQSADAFPRQTRYAPARIKDQGDFKLCYEPRMTPCPGEASPRVALHQEAIECIVDSLNERMALPYDITITFKECDGPDASYDDTTHQVTVCYDLIDDYYDLFSIEIKDEAALDEAVKGALASALFHELGHALMDAWNLPITGKEEDAADQLSTLILIEETEEGEQMALDGALAFKLYAALDGGEEKAYWDEHSLDEQRFYGILCMLYGHDPEKYEQMIKDGTLPASRAEMCKDDYAKLKKSWQTLLAPFVKTPSENVAKIRLR